jgi:predicted nucleic acid-binding protein
LIVLDASAALELLLATERGARVARRIASPDETLHAPHLIDLEVAQVLRRYELAGELAPARAAAALAGFCDLGVVRYEHLSLLGRVWKLRKNATACDAAYLSLAEALGAPLLTCDGKLAAAPGHRARVELVG